MIDVQKSLIRLNNKFPNLTVKELLDILDCMVEKDYWNTHLYPYYDNQVVNPLDYKLTSTYTCNLDNNKDIKVTPTYNNK